MRQLTPNSQLFIQQCEQPKVLSSSTVSSIAQKVGLSSSTTISQPLRGSVPARAPQMVRSAHTERRLTQYYTVLFAFTFLKVHAVMIYSLSTLL